jgi:hypothetical protein
MMQQASMILMLTTSDVSTYLKKIKATKGIIMDKTISQKLINHIRGIVG